MGEKTGEERRGDIMEMRERREAGEGENEEPREKRDSGT